ncbi:MAG: hypothetical protein COA57_06325 [Flavobacteriales bacterium]|nr:hypothetical protein [Bacteroidales bacterium AH-315-I05]PCJ86338.1 MAG: hypothetical protein COA57_06325 [Flavobacteriales bacterium]
MNTTEIIFDILKIAIPAGLVVLVAYLIVKKFFENEEKKRRYESRKGNQQYTLPVRLQAYERMILFLERVSPESMLMRMNKPGMSAKALQSELTKTIRQEYEHNMAQQIYISNGAWELVKNAKEEMIRLVNIAASKMRDKATGLELSKTIFTMISEVGALPTHVAINYLKKEVRRMF